MISTNIQLTEEQAQRLNLLAHKERVSTADLVRRAVDYWLQTTESSSLFVTEEQRQRAVAAVGTFRSGLTDLSDRHDDYLIEAYGDHTE